MFTFLVDKMDKTGNISISDSALYSLAAIVIVFLVLLMIIGITELVFKITGLYDLKDEIEKQGKNLSIKETTIDNNKSYCDINDIKDEDMMVAVLIASIDYQEQIKKDVRLVNVKEVK